MGYLVRFPPVNSPMAQLWGLDLYLKATGEYTATLQSPQREELVDQVGQTIPHPETGESCTTGDEPYLIAEEDSNPTSKWE